MGTQFYSIVPAGTDEPAGLFLVDDGEPDPDTFKLVQLNRLTNQWEENPNLVEYFIGEGGGDRALPISRDAALALASRWGAPQTSPVSVA